MVIENKEFNPNTSARDRRLIPVEDILEIEHTEGMRFELKYLESREFGGKSTSGFGSQTSGNKVAGAIGGLISKIKKKDAANAAAAKSEDPD